MDTIKLLLGAAAVATTSGAMLLAAGPAHARDVTVVASIENDVPVARVTFADLDLAGAAGQKTMRSRVGSAVRTVCAPAYDGTETTRYTACVNGAWDEARPQMAAAVARAGRLAAGQATPEEKALALNTLRVAAQ